MALSDMIVLLVDGCAPTALIGATQAARPTGHHRPKKYLPPACGCQGFGRSVFCVYHSPHRAVLETGAKSSVDQFSPQDPSSRLLAAERRTLGHAGVDLPLPGH